MKKVFFISMTIAVLATLVSCKKEAKIFHAHFGRDDMEKLHFYNDTVNHLYFPCWDSGGINKVRVNGILENVTLQSDKHVTFPCPESELDEENFYMFTMGTSAGSSPSPLSKNRYNFTIPRLIDISEEDLRNQHVDIPMGGYINQNNGDVNFKTSWAVIKFHYDYHYNGADCPMHCMNIWTNSDNEAITGSYSVLINTDADNPITITPIPYPNNNFRGIYFDDHNGYHGKFGTDYTDFFLAVPTNITQLNIAAWTACNGVTRPSEVSSNPTTIDLTGRLHPGKILVVDISNFFRAPDDI